MTETRSLTQVPINVIRKSFCCYLLGSAASAAIAVAVLPHEGELWLYPAAVCSFGVYLAIIRSTIYKTGYRLPPGQFQLMMSWLSFRLACCGLYTLGFIVVVCLAFITLGGLTNVMATPWLIAFSVLLAIVCEYWCYKLCVVSLMSKCTKLREIEANIGASKSTHLAIEQDERLLINDRNRE
jgi:hypothetical protein